MVREMFRVAALAALAAAAAGALCGSAAASVGVAFAPFSSPALRVDAQGNAEVSWSTGGAHDSVLIPPTGQYFHGSLPGADVSRPTSAAVIPYRVALRRTPDGRFWALQAWQTSPKGPLELRFSRWTGKPTEITLALEPKGRYEVLTGRATFHGRPVTGSYLTNAGVPIALAAALDCFGCPAAGGSGWFRFNGVKTRGDGTFGSGLQAAWMGKRYRATIVGPNLGTTLAPDAARIIPR
jgi:hypothetical protein